MKKLLKTMTSALVCAAMSVSAVMPAFAAKASFSDISGSQYDWCSTQIKSMATKGLITGYEDNTYRPDNDVTRQECLSLFARAMGSTDSANKSVVKLAKEMYGDTLSEYSLSWGEDEIAFLMYRGALKKADLVTYLKGDEKSKPMKRYEAAMIITKAMGGEKEALQYDKSSLDYSDAETIPATAAGYVKYAGDKEIMTGMENNVFSPLTSVSRSQIAVMLSRTVDKTNYTYTSSKLISIDTDNRTYVMKDSSGNSDTRVYDENTVMNSLGVQTIPSKMVVGVSAVFTYSGETLVYIDTFSAQPDETLSGKYVSSGSDSKGTYVNIIPTGKTEQETYYCADDVSIMYNGTPATMKSFVKNDAISLSLVDGMIEQVNAEEKTATISGAVVKSLSIDPKMTITIEHADDEYNGKTYEVSDNVLVKKNSNTSDLSEVYVGDSVTLTLEYGQITKVVATSKSTKITGIIKSLTIATQSSMIVSVNGKEQEYMIPSVVAIKINNNEGTLYDFRVGDSVTLTVESQAITAISATSTQTTSGSVTGKVTAINASYGFITVLPDDATEAQTVFCKDTKTTFISVTGKAMKMSGVKEGDSVDVKGTVSNGAFVATLVIVTPES